MPSLSGLTKSIESFQPLSPKKGSSRGVNSRRMLGEKANESPKALKSSVETKSGVVLRPSTVAPNAPDSPTYASRAQKASPS
jgi:hypothetical protein